jgi:hypothetical protein
LFEKIQPSLRKQKILPSLKSPIPIFNLLTNLFSNNISQEILKILKIFKTINLSVKALSRIYPQAIKSLQLLAKNNNLFLKNNPKIIAEAKIIYSLLLKNNPPFQKFLKKTMYLFVKIKINSPLEGLPKFPKS